MFSSKIKWDGFLIYKFCLSFSPMFFFPWVSSRRSFYPTELAPRDRTRAFPVGDPVTVCAQAVGSDSVAHIPLSGAQWQCPAWASSPLPEAMGPLSLLPYSHSHSEACPEQVIITLGHDWTLAFCLPDIYMHICTCVCMYVCTYTHIRFIAIDMLQNADMFN